MAQQTNTFRYFDTTHNRTQSEIYRIFEQAFNETRASTEILNGEQIFIIDLSELLNVDYNYGRSLDNKSIFQLTQRSSNMFSTTNETPTHENTRRTYLAPGFDMKDLTPEITEATNSNDIKIA